MKCYFMRHGVAVAADQWKGSDAERPLTGGGIERMRAESKRIAALDLQLDVIVTSPLIRARRTAEIVADALNARNALVEDRRVAPGFDKKAVQSILNDYPEANAVMLVGHEPSMSATISDLIGGARITFKKGGLACVNINSRFTPAGDLLWLAHPTLLLA